MRQTVSQSDPLPGQQAVRAELREQRRIEDADGGLSHQEAAPKEVKVIQRHQEAWRKRTRSRFFFFLTVSKGMGVKEQENNVVMRSSANHNMLNLYLLANEISIFNSTSYFQ